MNAYGYTLLGLTALVGALVSALVFALLKFMAAARSTRRQMRDGGTDTTLFSTALHDALSRGPRGGGSGARRAGSGIGPDGLAG